MRATVSPRSASDSRAAQPRQTIGPAGCGRVPAGPAPAATLLPGGAAAVALAHRSAALLGEPSLPGCGRRLGRDPGYRLPRAAQQRLADPLERSGPDARLRPDLGRHPHDPGRQVTDPHARLGLVLLLPAGSRGA